MDSPYFILLCSAVAVWYAVRYFRLKRGISDLTQALRATPPEGPIELPRFTDIPTLYEFRRILADTLSEASLLRDSERKQREFQDALLNEIKDAIFILDRNREIRFVNEAARQLFPSQQPYQSRDFLEVCRDHRVEDTLDLAEELGSKVSEHISLRVSDGRSNRLRDITLLVEAEPLSFGQNAGITGSWLMMKDITAELETEQIRRDFVANASHELRTPLSIINGYLETMDEPDTDLGQAIFRRAIRTMRKHGDRIARIIEDMLMISKLESAADLLNFEPFDLRDSVEEMIRQLAPIIESKHARVSVQANPAQDWSFVGDRFYWDQIFFNLIENALKQNGEPGLRVTIAFTLEEGRYLVRVIDDGIGIPAADLPLIFKRFYRVEKHHAQNQVKGTGLGLSIVKRAVEAHHGRIEVESQPGVRTTFTITVPQSFVRTPDAPIGRDGNDA
ncbi:MAG: ATP-binding protein [Verrucomicrobiales bacterium]|nr:ATP-binding protein [Verrucomicrobiales bacterium]